MEQNLFPDTRPMHPASDKVRSNSYRFLGEWMFQYIKSSNFKCEIPCIAKGFFTTPTHPFQTAKFGMFHTGVSLCHPFCNTPHLGSPLIDNVIISIVILLHTKHFQPFIIMLIFILNINQAIIYVFYVLCIYSRIFNCRQKVTYSLFILNKASMAI